MEHLSILAAKTAITLILLVIAYRFLGKRQAGQLNIYDLAMIMALANAVQNAMTEGKGDLSVGLVSSSTLILIGWAATRILLRSRRAERLMLGMPTVLINRGKLLKDRLRREHVSRDEVMAAIRAHGLYGPEQVKLAVLEIDGTISVIPKKEAQGGCGPEGERVPTDPQ